MCLTNILARRCGALPIPELVHKLRALDSSKQMKVVQTADGIFALATLVHTLIEAYGLLNHLNVVSSNQATEEDIRNFHSQEFVECLQSLSENGEDTEDEDAFGIGFDCPPLQDTWLTVKELAGASLCAADVLIKGESRIAINWCGGWHHAQRDEVSGFCYVNDIVLAIQRLRRKFDRILYIDLDVHHGDGVENAYLFSPKVLTLSLHQQEPGFFPGSGSVSDVGKGKGSFFTVNVPYKSGITDSQLNHLLERSLSLVSEVFTPDAVVCQCGADSLSQDPLGAANVSLEGYLSCIKQVIKLNKPSLFLGGGGYSRVNAAKLWTAVTFLLLNLPVPEEIPEHKFFPLYGPDFIMNVNASLRKSENTAEYLEKTLEIIKENLGRIRKSLKPEETS